ncbi:MAG: Ig-like domain-containing protein, partial [Candidatus Eisenbacteria bacterium]|nr:Ig-like domain-containing protein [Candidatus Eisenbacteria bacterium]
MRRPIPILLIVSLCALAAVFAGCSKKSTAPAVSGGGNASHPIVIATQPAARSASAPYDSDIWAQFDRGLDGRTVSAQTAYLKLDGQRLLADVTYDGITRRIFLRPRSVLALQRTYTVEFSTAIKALDGSSMPEGVFFQFTTNSLRHVTYDFPAEGELEGPVSALGWGGALGAQNNLFYEVYASEDSAAVVLRTAPRLQRSVFTRYLPSTAWPAGSRVFWAITAENFTTGERENGPLQSFHVTDGSAPIDSVVIRPSDHGSSIVTNRNTQYCNQPFLPAGPNFNAAIHWNFTGLPADARIVDARLQLWFLDQNSGAFAAAQPVVWMAQNEWSACIVTAPGPPFAEPSGLLANGFAVNALETDFLSDRLSAAVEALARRRTFVFSTV